MIQTKTKHRLKIVNEEERKNIISMKLNKKNWKNQNNKRNHWLSKSKGKETGSRRDEAEKTNQFSSHNSNHNVKDLNNSLKAAASRAGFPWRTNYQ
jgi:hypothetical protein